MADVAVLLPLAVFALMFAWLRSGTIEAAADTDWRNHWLSACAGWGLAVAAITELLGATHALERTYVAIAWTLLAAVLASLIRLRVRGVRPHRNPAREPPEALRPMEWILLAGVVVVVGCVAVIAILAPPNNWDSMTYHMSRVAHWIQNRSVDHYPTSITRQLYLSPWAEFAILQFQILTANDRWANLIQWMSMVSSLVGVSLITRELGGHARLQVLSVAVAASIPMGILQASSTQNDYVLACWLVCAIYYLLRLFRAGNSQQEMRGGILFGACLSLAILAKGTAYIYSLPLLACFVAWIIQAQMGRRLAIATLIGLTIGTVNIGQWTRNAAMFGNVLGPDEETKYYANERVTAAVVTSNIARNIGLHLPMPMSVFERLHGAIGADINDPRTSLGGGQPPFNFDVTPPRLHEDYSGNGLHALMLLLSITGAVVASGGSGQSGIRWYAVALVVAFVAFCTYLKWQPWGSRLHLPLFVAGSPIVALCVGRLRRANLASLIGAVLLLAATPWVFFNESRPLIESIRPMNFTGVVQTANDGTLLDTARIDLYFWNRRELIGPYKAAVKHIKDGGCGNVGLALGDDDYEYPLWVLQGSHGKIGPALTHVVQSNGRLHGAQEMPPCAVIVVGAPLLVSLHVLRQTYRDEWQAAPVTVFTHPRSN
jgi:hypothetical protein